MFDMIRVWPVMFCLDRSGYLAMNSCRIFDAKRMSNPVTACDKKCLHLGLTKSSLNASLNQVVNLFIGTLSYGWKVYLKESVYKYLFIRIHYRFKFFISNCCKDFFYGNRYIITDCIFCTTLKLLVQHIFIFKIFFNIYIYRNYRRKLN